MFTSLCWYEFKRGHETATSPIELTGLQKELLQLLKIDPAIYA